MSTTDIGNAAETAVVKELIRQGFKVLDRNWKTKLCEVDIIVEKDAVVWFIEVKYRHTERFGSGLEYIGPSKLRHMRIAANLWVDTHDYAGEYTLGAISVTGQNIVNELVEI
ncbi:MAG: Ribonuclease [Candidatus Saccharibacteria bacterium]|nr:Ribonuclease [Candidatus Saccharibacteria bacterium]